MGLGGSLGAGDENENTQEMADKWESYYSRGFTPWDSHKPCSQLAMAFDIRINGPPPAPPSEDGSTGDSGEHGVAIPTRGPPTQESQKSQQQKHEEHEALVDELEAKYEERMKQEVASQIEGAEGDMLEVLIDMLRGTYVHYKSRRGMSLEDALKAFTDRKESGQKEFVEKVKGRQMHESVVAMYVEKFVTTFDEHLMRLSTDLRAVIAKDAAEQRAAMEALKQLDLGNISSLICPSFVVGNYRNPAEWTCAEFGCGTGSSSVWMAQRGCSVVGIDLISVPLREASAKAFTRGVARHCVLVQGDIFDMERAAFTFSTAQKVLNTHIEGDGESGAKGVVALKSLLVGNKEGVPVNGGDFDFVFDCQCFHVLREAQNDAKAVNAVRSILRPGGLLMVLTGNDREPQCGPAVLSRKELVGAFKASFDEEAVIETRFDPTHEYDKLPHSPLAWCGLFRKRLELDASRWLSVSDCWKDLLGGLRCPQGHRAGFDRLEKSVAGDENGVKRPITVAVGRLGAMPAPIQTWTQMLKELFEQMERDGTFKDGRIARVVVL